MTFAKTESFEMSKVLVVFVCVLLGVLGEEDGNEVVSYQEGMNETLVDFENMVHYISQRVENLENRKTKGKEGEERIMESMNHLYTTVNSAIQHANYIKNPSNVEFDSQQQPVPIMDPFLSKQTDCGSIQVGESGFVFYHAANPPFDKSACTWTLRANLSENIAIKVLSDNLDPRISSIILTPMIPLIQPDVTYEVTQRAQIIVLPGDRNTYELQGAVAFVTLVSNATNDEFYYPSFTLYFEGRGNSSYYRNRTFTHYHYTREWGSTAYPNGQEYRNNEVVTWTLTPSVLKPGNFSIKFDFVDIEGLTRCSGDFVKFFNTEVGREFYMQFGWKAKDYRVCGKHDSISKITFVNDKYEKWIAVMWTDESVVGKGIQFSWDSR